MMRIIFVLLVVALGLVGFIVIGLDGLEERQKRELDVIESGGRDAKRRGVQGTMPASVGAWPRGAQDLLVRLGPTGDAPEAAVLFLLRGNGVCAYREDATRAVWQRTILDKKGIERVLTIAQEAPEASSSGPGDTLAITHWHPESTSARRKVASAVSTRLIEAVSSRARIWWPKRFGLVLSRESEDGSLEDVTPWPRGLSERSVPEDDSGPLAGCSHEMPVVGSVAREFLKDLLVGDVIGPDDSGVHHRVRAIRTPLP